MINCLPFPLSVMGSYLRIYLNFIKYTLNKNMNQKSFPLICVKNQLAGTVFVLVYSFKMANNIKECMN